MGLWRRIVKARKYSRLWVFSTTAFVTLASLLAYLETQGIQTGFSGDMRCGGNITCEGYFWINVPYSMTYASGEIVENFDGICFGNNLRVVVSGDGEVEDFSIYKADRRYREDNPERWRIPYEFSGSDNCLVPGNHSFKINATKPDDVDVKWGVAGTDIDPVWKRTSPNPRIYGKPINEGAIEDCVQYAPGKLLCEAVLLQESVFERDDSGQWRNKTDIIRLDVKNDFKLNFSDSNTWRSLDDVIVNYKGANISLTDPRSIKLLHGKFNATMKVFNTWSSWKFGPNLTEIPDGVNYLVFKWNPKSTMPQFGYSDLLAFRMTVEEQAGGNDWVVKNFKRTVVLPNGTYTIVNSFFDPETNQTTSADSSFCIDTCGGDLDANFGTDAALRMSSKADNQGNTWMFGIRYNFTHLPASVVPNDVVWVKLNFVVRDAGPITLGYLNRTNAESDWTETGLTGNNNGCGTDVDLLGQDPQCLMINNSVTMSAGLDSAFVLDDTKNLTTIAKQVIDVTDQFSLWVIQVRDGGNAEEAQFYSRDAAVSADKKPIMTVLYTVNAPEFDRANDIVPANDAYESGKRRTWEINVTDADGSGTINVYFVTNRTGANVTTLLGTGNKTTINASTLEVNYTLQDLQAGSIIWGWNADDGTNAANHSGILTISQATCIILINGTAGNVTAEHGMTLNVSGQGCGSRLAFNMTYFEALPNPTIIDAFTAIGLFSNGSKSLNLTSTSNTGNHTLNFTLDRSIDLINATMNVSGYPDGSGNYPKNVKIDTLNNSLIDYEFPGYANSSDGPDTFRQNEFKTGEVTKNFTFSIPSSITEFINISANGTVVRAKLNYTGFSETIQTAPQARSVVFSCLQGCESDVSEGDDGDFSTGTGNGISLTQNYSSEYSLPANNASITEIELTYKWSVTASSGLCSNANGGRPATSIFFWNYTKDGWDIVYNRESSVDGNEKNSTFALPVNASTGWARNGQNFKIKLGGSSTGVVIFCEDQVRWKTGATANVSIDVGSDGVLDWNETGTFDYTTEVDLNVSAFNNYRNTSCRASGVCSVPVTFSAGASGKTNASRIDVRYQDRVDFNTTVMQLFLANKTGSQRQTVNATVSWVNGGILNVSGVSTYYKGTGYFTITSHSSANATANTTTLRVLHSNFTLGYPNKTVYKNTRIPIFLPKSFNATNTTPFGQTGSDPFFNVTGKFHDADARLGIANNATLPACMNIKAANNSAQLNYVNISTSTKLILSNLTRIDGGNHSQGLWFWLDLSNDCHQVGEAVSNISFIITPCSLNSTFACW